jgi:hypothetical protein
MKWLITYTRTREEFGSTVSETYTEIIDMEPSGWWNFNHWSECGVWNYCIITMVHEIKSP